MLSAIRRHTEKGEDFKMKKIISIILSIALAISFSAVNAFADNETAVNQPDETKLGLLKSVYGGFIESDGEYMSRFDFIRNAMGLMGFDADSAAVTDFTDIDPTRVGGSAVKYALSQGLISYGLYFYPDSPITYEQAVKIAAVSCGYGKSAEAKGGYPYGYLAAASSAGLLSDVTTTLSYSDCVNLLYNMMTEDIMEQTGFGDDEKFEVKKDTNLLYVYHDIKTVEGIVTADEYSPLLYSGDTASDGRIRIGSAEYEINTDKTYLGYNVKVYYTEASKHNKAVYIEPVSNREVTFDADDVDEFDAKKISVENGSGKTKDYNLSDVCKIIYNGKAYITNTPDELLDYDSAVFTLVDNDDNGTYDVIYANCRTYMQINRVDETNEMIVGENGSYVSYKDDDCKISYYAVNEDGDFAKTDISALAANGIIACEVSEDGMKIAIYVLTGSVSGTISEFSTDDDEFYIDGVKYKCTGYMKDESAPISVGSKCTVLLGFGNDAVVCTTSSPKLKYGFVVATAFSTDLERKCRVKIFTEDSEMLECDIAAKLKIDAAGSKKDTDAKTLLDSLIASGDENRLIRYKLNSDGEINAIDTVQQASDSSVLYEEKNNYDSLNKYYGSLDSTMTYKSGSFIPRFNLSDVTPCFVIPTSDEEIKAEKYYVVNKDYFANDKSYQVVSYDLDGSGTAGAVMTRPTTVFSDDSGAAVIEDIVKVINNDGEEVYNVCLWADGVFMRYEADDTEDMGKTVSALKKGDIIRYMLNRSNKLYKITKDLSIYSEEYNTVNQTYTTYVRGRVYSKKGDWLEICANTDMQDGISFDKLVNYQIKSNTKVVFIDAVKDKTSGDIKKIRIYHAPTEAIKDYISCASDASYIILRTVSCEAKTAFVINYTDK